MLIEQLMEIIGFYDIEMEYRFFAI